MRKLAIVLVVGLSGTACSGWMERPAANMAEVRSAKKEVNRLRATIKQIEPFFRPMGKPEAYDWLGSHVEAGQTFDEYIDSSPVEPTSERQKIYILPLGSFTAQQKKIIQTTAGYLQAFYDLPVQQMPPKQMPPVTRSDDLRITSTRGVTKLIRQVRTGFIMDSILMPLLPDDAAALIAFTNDDLFPDASMSYVFGQASLGDRVGVWSLSRLDDNANYDKFLRRTIKIAVHETGHMFSIKHCTKFECVMSGTNYLGETDRRPIDACPECSAKVCWLSDADPAERYDRLATFCKQNDLTAEAAEFTRKSAAVRAR